MAFNKIFKNIKTSIENILENNNEQSGKSGENIHDMSGEIQQGRLYLQHRKKEEIEYINSQKRLRVSEGYENIENETYDTSVKKVIQSEMNEIKQLHTSVKEFSLQGLNTEEILIQVFKEESFSGIMTNGELSRLNMIKSLMEWK